MGRFPLIWRLRWHIRKRFCWLGRCQGKVIDCHWGIGWQCGTCGQVKHWETFRSSQPS